MPLWLRILRKFYPDAGWYQYSVNDLQPEKKAVYGPLNNGYERVSGTIAWYITSHLEFHLHQPDGAINPDEE